MVVSVVVWCFCVGISAPPSDASQIKSEFQRKMEAMIDEVYLVNVQV